MKMLTDVTETVVYISSDHRGALMQETFPWMALAFSRWVECTLGLTARAYGMGFPQTSDGHDFMRTAGRNVNSLMGYGSVRTPSHT